MCSGQEAPNSTEEKIIMAISHRFFSQTSNKIVRERTMVIATTTERNRSQILLKVVKALDFF